MALEQITRASARKRGLKRFYTGPCRFGHNSVRMVSNGCCVRCLNDRVTKMRRSKRTPKTKATMSAADYMRKWEREHIEHRRAYARHRSALARRDCTNAAIATRLRGRLNIAIRKGSRAGSAVSDLGCSLAEFRDYIKSKFIGEMEWNNWGKVWHLDHIRPLSLFDLSKRDQFLEACHFTNYQPLRIAEHHEKSVRDRAIAKELRSAFAEAAE